MLDYFVFFTLLFILFWSNACDFNCKKKIECYMKKFNQCARSLSAAYLNQTYLYLLEWKKLIFWYLQTLLNNWNVTGENCLDKKKLFLMVLLRKFHPEYNGGTKGEPAWASAFPKVIMTPLPLNPQAKIFQTNTPKVSKFKIVSQCSVGDVMFLIEIQEANT